MAADVTVAPTLGHAVLMTQGGVGASPGYDAVDLRRMIQAGNGELEGVFNSTGWLVREHTSGANMQVQVDANVGLARVDGESVTHQGPYIVAPHSGVITLDVSAAHSTNPRIDIVVLHIRDNTHDALGSNDARVRILTGTATSGATLANLNGSPSLPSNAIRLANVLVPATDTTISNAQIADTRPIAWAAAGAFSAWMSAAPSNSLGPTLIVFGTEEFDVSRWFDNGANSRYQPLVAGYYRLSAGAFFANTGDGAYQTLDAYKNGVVHRRFGGQNFSGATNGIEVSGSTIVQANGTTDYFDVRWIGSVSNAPSTGATVTYFQGEMVAPTR